MAPPIQIIRPGARAGVGADGIEVRPVAGALGAEIYGVDPRTLDSSQTEALKEILHQYEVLFFPGVNLAEGDHMDFARSFGLINVFPLARLQGDTTPTFTVITDGPDSPPEADYWHTDVTWVAEPPNYALLHAEVVPERGGDTLWASMTAAYETLSSAIQRLVDDLEVVHDNESFIEGMLRKVPDDPAIFAVADSLRKAYAPVIHPLVRTHPDTGRQALFLGGRFMKRVVGMRELESSTLLDFLQRHIEDPALQCRWRWQPGDLAVWDERSTNHRSAADHYPQARSIRRVEVAGERPYHRAPADPGVA